MGLGIVFAYLFVEFGRFSICGLFFAQIFGYFGAALVSKGKSGSSHFGRPVGVGVQVAKRFRLVFVRRGKSGSSHIGRPVGGGA